MMTHNDCSREHLYPAGFALSFTLYMYVFNVSMFLTGMLCYVSYVFMSCAAVCSDVIMFYWGEAEAKFPLRWTIKFI